MNLNAFAISGLTLAFTNLILVIILFLYGRSRLHRVCLFFNLNLVIWGIGSFYLGKLQDPHSALILWRYITISITFIPIFNYHLVSILCKSENKKLLLLIYAQGIIFSFFSALSPLLLSSVRYVFHSFYYDVGGILLYPYFIIWMTIVGYSHFLLIKTFLQSRNRLRNQILYFFAGTALGFSGGLTNFFPAFGINFYPFGNFTIPIYCLIVTYAILKFRLLDISIVFTRAGIFIAVYSLILGTPLLIIYYLQNQLVSLFGLSWWVVPFLCSTALATLGPFLYIYFDKKAEDKLLSEQKSYQNILRAASAGMIRIRNLDLLLKLIVYVVAKIVKIKHVAVYLLDSENHQFSLRASRMSQPGGIKYFTLAIESPVIQKLTTSRETIVAEEISLRSKDEPKSIPLAELTRQLFDLDASLAIPSFVEDKLIGILVLGEKRSGKLYSQDDLAVFSVLANQAALAIENAQFYEEIKQTHEQLFQAEKMATIGTMADGLSHQINNRFHALSLIAGDSLDMLKTFDWSNCNEETKQVFSDLKNALERIEANVLQGGEVVKGLLKYSRPGDGGFEAIGFKDVINGSIDMLQYKIKLKEIDLVQNIPSELPKLYGNLTQLQEVFFNMIDNAYDAIKERQLLLKEEGYRGKIEISASQNNGSVEIIVSDNGMGIKDIDKKKLFTPFFTTKATAKKGTGLGLYVIEKIIASHNGKIKIDSAYQKGTSFIITLPLKPA